MCRDEKNYIANGGKKIAVFNVRLETLDKPSIWWHLNKKREAKQNDNFSAAETTDSTRTRQQIVVTRKVNKSEN